MKFKIAVLVSGRGSNLQAIINSIENCETNAEIAIVISNVGNVYALERAKKHNIKTLFLDPKLFITKEAYDKEIVNHLRENNVDLICLAGFMRVLSKVIIDEYAGKIINIHPSLLPAFPGLKVQKKALEYGVKFSGCTVHFVDEGVDTGPIILQAVVPVLEDDTIETLTLRILKEEHKIYPKVIQAIAIGCLKINGRRVKISK